MININTISGNLTGWGALPCPTTISGDSLPNVWATAVWAVNSMGMVIPADMPKADGVVVLTRDLPGLTMDLRQRAFEDAVAKKVHPLCTITEEKALKTYCDQYELTTDRGWKSATEHVYSYADRFENHPRTLRSFIQRNELGRMMVLDDMNHGKLDVFGTPSFNQTEYIAENIQPYTRRFVMKTWVADIDYDNPESPCLQTVMVRQLDDEGHCDIYEHYRSLDVFGASIYDIIGQANYINEHIIKPNDLIPVRMLVNANSAHIYERDWAKASAIPPVMKPLPLGCIVNGF